MQVLYWKEIKQGGLMRAEKRFLLFVNRRHRYCQGPLAGNRSVVVVTPERNLSYFDKQRIAFRPSGPFPFLPLKMRCIDFLFLAWHWQSSMDFRTPAWREACTILHSEQLQCTLPGQK